MGHRFICLAAALMLCACTAKEPVVSVTGGKIQGVPSGAEGVTVFKGIPYAAPPVGDLRWKSPGPVIPWDGIRKAGTFGPIAWQNGNPKGTFYGDEFYWEGTPDCSEDCLYLNIWAPSSSIGKESAGLPVCLWIHGGAFMNGYGHEVTMDGDAWAKRNVILVTINYRLGPLGFLSHPDLSAEQDGVSGNYGTMDQIAALRWVRDNISAFGGDPDNITLMGQSAGAMSVKTLVSSPMAKDMVAKAIIQSGGGVSDKPLFGGDGIPQDFFDKQGKDIMENAGLSGIATMRAASPEELLGAMGKYTADGKGWVMLAPHNDGKYITESFDKAVSSNTVADIPYMIGCTAQDLAGVGGSSIDTFCCLRDSLSEKPVYQYFFSRNLPGDDDDPEKDPGAFHSSELWYMFGTLDRSWRPFTEADHALSERMLDAWTSFCRDGNPGWDPYSAENPSVKIFDVENQNPSDSIAN